MSLPCVQARKPGWLRSPHLPQQRAQTRELPLAQPAVQRPLPESLGAGSAFKTRNCLAQSGMVAHWPRAQIERRGTEQAAVRRCYVWKCVEACVLHPTPAGRLQGTSSNARDAERTDRSLPHLHALQASQSIRACGQLERVDGPGGSLDPLRGLRSSKDEMERRGRGRGLCLLWHQGCITEGGSRSICGDAVWPCWVVLTTAPPPAQIFPVLQQLCEV